MSSASRLSYFGPEDFPSLRAFLQRSGYSLEGCEKPETRMEAAKHLCEIFSDGSHNPVQMLDMLLAIRAQRLSQSNQRELEAWENEGAIRPRKSLQNPWSCDGLLESGSD
ncbi:hypothetical protein QLQ11_23015 [Ochrobactrum sp. SSR]|uniref:hypothetical protein n=1 Tax=Ochrobactrum sp. SSR TaxID=3045176 RepID=UPI0027A10D55|nr:hypothetical protein QLQ11_23015 [Ochrobactrum sp. SSR]